MESQNLTFFMFFEFGMPLLKDVSVAPVPERERMETETPRTPHEAPVHLQLPEMYVVSELT